MTRTTCPTRRPTQGAPADDHVLGDEAEAAERVETKCAVGVSDTSIPDNEPALVVGEYDDKGGVHAPSAYPWDDHVFSDAAMAAERVAPTCAFEIGATPAVDKEPAPVVQVEDDNGGVPAPSGDLADVQMLFDAAVAAEQVATMCAFEVGPTPAADKEPAPVGEENDDNGGVPAPSADLADDQMLFDAAMESERVATKCAVEVGTTPAADNVPAPVVAVSDDKSGATAPSADLADYRCSSTRLWPPIRPRP